MQTLLITLFDVGTIGRKLTTQIHNKLNKYKNIRHIILVHFMEKICFVSSLILL